MKEQNKRQGQLKLNGKKAIPKPLCPKHGEYLKRIYTRERIDSKWRYSPYGWACPSSSCDYIIKDFVVLKEETESMNELEND